jgi:hypothetical protein
MLPSSSTTEAFASITSRRWHQVTVPPYHRNLQKQTADGSKKMKQSYAASAQNEVKYVMLCLHVKSWVSCLDTLKVFNIKSKPKFFHFCPNINLKF